MSDILERALKRAHSSGAWEQEDYDAMNELVENAKKQIEMKDFTYSAGHEFNEEDVKERWNDLKICPFCWPHGFLKGCKSEFGSSHRVDFPFGPIPHWLNEFIDYLLIKTELAYDQTIEKLHECKYESEEQILFDNLNYLSGNICAIVTIKCKIQSRETKQKLDHHEFGEADSPCLKKRLEEIQKYLD